MKMFIINPTRQAHQFMYRLPREEGGGEHAISIPVPQGGQVMLPGDLSRPAIDAIIEQKRPFGFLPFDQAAKSREYTGVCYSIDKAAPSADRIWEVLRSNDAARQEGGRRLREQAAIALSDNIEQQMQEQRMPDRLRGLELSYREDVPDAHADDGAEHAAEGIRIGDMSYGEGSRDGPPPAPARSRRRRA